MVVVSIVTGSNRGIGLAVVKKLYDLPDQHIIMACRDEIKSLEEIKKIKKEGNNNMLEFMALDLSSLDHIRLFVAKFHEKKIALHLLINNAGIYSTTYRKTRDDLEETFQVNYLGHFLLTNLFLEDLKKSQPSRIINVSSNMHIPGVSGKPPRLILDKKSINWTEEQFNGDIAYKNSKLCNVLFTYELERRLKGSDVYVNAVSPGFVPTTGLSRDSPYIFQLLMYYVISYLPMARTEVQGADNVLCIPIGITGKYYSNLKETKSSDESYSLEMASKLWTLSQELTGV